MGDEIELISDGEGLTVVGGRQAVETFLRSEGLWDSVKELDLRRVTSHLGTGAEITRTASEISASSAQWLKLTPESARLRQEHGLMSTKTPGVSHAMVGKPGDIKNWLQTVDGPGSLLTNPAVLSGVAGIMAQVAKEQTIAEVIDYLAEIDEKVDDVLAKVDGTVLKDMRGARLQIRRATTMRAEEGRVTDDAWSEVQNASGKLADVQGYALLQLEEIAAKLESQTRIGGLSKSAEETKSEVRKWLAVLAECFQLQDSFDVLVLDRALDSAPEILDARRRGLEADRRDRRDLTSRHTEQLLARMDTAVSAANAHLFWNRAKSPTVVESGNHVAARVHEFHELVGIESNERSWTVRQLGRAAEIGAQTVQKSKDGAPVVVAVGATVLVIGKRFQNQGSQKSG